MAKKIIKENALVVQDRQLASLTDIQARIYPVRGVQVMLDRDLAVFYKVETAQLNRQVKRNIGRFPEDFMFQLTKEEWEVLKCQIGISNIRGGDRRALPEVTRDRYLSPGGYMYQSLVNLHVPVPRQPRHLSLTPFF